MKFDIVMTHADYAKHNGPNVAEGLVAAWSTIKRLGKRLLRALEPRNYDEEFLNGAQNHADLERRIQILMRSERWQGNSRY